MRFTPDPALERIRQQARALLAAGQADAARRCLSLFRAHGVPRNPVTRHALEAALRAEDPDMARAFMHDLAMSATSTPDHRHGPVAGR